MQEIQWDYMRNTFWSQMGTAILWSGSMVLNCNIHPSILFIVMQLYPSKSAAAVSSGWYFVPHQVIQGPVLQLEVELLLSVLKQSTGGDWWASKHMCESSQGKK
jgi:hypothetical protein